MFSTVTGCSCGHVANARIGSATTRAIMFTSSPHRPRLHRRTGSGGPKRRRQTRQLIVMKYEVNIAIPERELTALMASTEPMLILNCQHSPTEMVVKGLELRPSLAERLTREIREVNATETRTALTGMFHSGWTRASQSEKGRPAKTDQYFHDSTAGGEMLTLVTSK